MAEKASTPRFLGILQLSLNKFFDLSTPSMRKGCNGEKSGEKIMIFIVVTNIIAS